MGFNSYILSFVSTMTLVGFTPAQVWSESSSTPAESSAGGGAEMESSGNVTGSGGNSDREFAKRRTRLNVLETKVKDLNKQLEKLIHLKKTGGAALDEKGKPIDVLATIGTSYQELKKSVTEYNSEKEELRFRYPEEGERLDRRYVPLRVQTLEEIEQGSGLETELTATKKKIDKKYSTIVGDQLAKPPTKAEPATSTLRDKKSEEKKQAVRIRLTQ